MIAESGEAWKQLLAHLLESTVASFDFYQDLMTGKTA
jgi:hypothetical protein